MSGYIMELGEIVGHRTLMQYAAIIIIEKFHGIFIGIFVEFA